MPILNGQQFGELRDLLARVFKIDALTQLMRVEMDIELEQIVTVGQPMLNVAFDLIDWLEPREKTRDFLRALRQARGDVPAVVTFCAQFLGPAPAKGGAAGPSLRPLTPQLLELLHQLTVAAYDRASLERLLRFRLNVRMDDITAPAELDVVVFNLIRWAEAQGLVEKLAEALAAGRPERHDFQVLLPKIKAALGAAAPPQPPVEPPPAMGAALPRLKGPPDELRELIRRFELLRRIMADDGDKIAELNKLVAAMRDLPLEEYDLTDYLHLSVSAGERLAAIASLNKLPNPRYLHWLAERLAVEDPFLGSHAGLALYAAARTIPVVDLDDVIVAVECALAWLPAKGKGTARDDVLTKAMKHVADRTAGRAQGDAFNL